MSSIFEQISKDPNIPLIDVDEMVKPDTMDNDTKSKETQPKVVKEKVKISKTPNRLLPPLIELIMEKGISVKLTKEGYLIGGFYGLNNGYLQLFEQDSTSTISNVDALIAMDNRKKMHVINHFDDLIKMNLTIWKVYSKEKEFKHLDNEWYPHIIGSEFISITPNF